MSPSRKAASTSMISQTHRISSDLSHLYNERANIIRIEASVATGANESVKSSPGI